MDLKLLTLMATLLGVWRFKGRCWLVRCQYRLVGLVVKASASRAEDPGFGSRFAPGFFRGRVILVI